MLSERLFEDILVKYHELIEDKLKYIGRQVTLFGKRIDILFEDRFNEKLIVELKIGNLQRDALSQVLEYVGYILSEKDPSARAMVIANRIPLSLKKAMDHYGIEYKEITQKQLFEFLEKRDMPLFQTIVEEKPIYPLIEVGQGIFPSSEPTSPGNKLLYATITDVKTKSSVNERFEIWFKKSSEKDIPYGNVGFPELGPFKIRVY